MSSLTKLSYGFLSFNNWPILERTLESAKKLKHTQGEVQWVIVDNSTKDFYVDMENNILNWCNKNNDLKVDTIFNQGNNTGEGAGMNTCFDLCVGENILFFQDDWECTVYYSFIDLGIKALDCFKDVFMIQLSKRPWSTTNNNIKMGSVIMTDKNKTVCRIQPNGFGNNTFQVRLFKKDRWQKVGYYLEDKDIPLRWSSHRPGSVSERDYGIRLASLGYCAAKINDGQFIHTIAENARMHFIDDE